MSALQNLYCIVGPSGSGKTTLVDHLSQMHKGVYPVISYTTRPKRKDETDGEGHFFVSEEDFDQLGEMVAYTKINGYRYGVTKDILEVGKLYVIDPAGISYLKKHYHDTNIVVIGMMLKRDVCEARMRERGDSEENIENRLDHDESAFSNLANYCDVMVDASLPKDKLARLVWSIIQEYEPKGWPRSAILHAFQTYVSNDAETAESEYVREALKQAGINEEEAEKLGFGWIMDLANNSQE